MICSVINCEKKVIAKGLCWRHYRQVLRCGKILYTGYKHVHSSNDFVIEGDTCKIIIYDKYGKKRHIAVIDKQDYHLVKSVKWGLSGNGYVYSKATKKHGELILSRLINKPPDGYLTDHADCNPLNNRRGNLRTCTSKENARNRRRHKNNTSGFKGVSWFNPTSKWRAVIFSNGRQKTLGYFDIIKDAAIMYDKTAIKLFGDFARINF